MAVRRIRIRALIAGLTAVAGLSVGFLTGSPPANASIVIGCPTATSSTPASGVASWDVTIDWDLDGYTDSTTASLTDVADWVDIDADGDGTADSAFSIYPVTDWSHYNTFGGYFDTGTGTWVPFTYQYRNDAVSQMISNSAIDDVMLDRLGIDYSTATSVDYTYYPGPLLGDFDQMTVYAKMYDYGTGSVDLPEGTISIGIDLTRTSGDTDSYELVMDTSGSDGSDTAWPSTVQNVLFIDFDTSDTVALGTSTHDSDGTVVPWSTLQVGADVTMVESDVQKVSVLAGYDGTYSESAGTVTSAGHPGEAAIGATIDCQDSTDPASTPYDWFFAGYSDASMTAAPPAPEKFELALDIQSESSNLYADASMTDSPAGWDVKLSADDADVDYDPTTDNWTDFDSDGTIDALAHNMVEIARSTDSTPALDLVFASESHYTAKSDLYAALELDALPEYISADYAGDTSAFDADGDGTDDSAVTAMNVVQLVFCNQSWGTWPSRSCATPAETSGDIRFTIATELPTADADGHYAAEFGEFASAPDDIKDTASAHFSPDPEYFAEYTSDRSAETWTLTGYVTGVEEITYQKNSTSNEIVAGFTTTGIEQFGIAAQIIDSDSNEIDIWATLADLAEVVWVAIDTEQAATDGDPASVSWDLRDANGNPHTTGAAIGLDQRQATGEQRKTHASMWAGTGDGSSDGIPSAATIAYDFSDTASALDIDSASDMNFEAGLTTSSQSDRTHALGPHVLRAHAHAVIPQDLELYWALTDGKLTRLDLITCDASSPCPIRDPYAIVVYESGGIDEDADGEFDAIALNGLTIPDIPDTAVDDPSNDAFPDFAGPVTDYVHGVLRYDPETKGDDDITDELTEWGIELALASLDTAGFARSEAAIDTFDTIDMCFSAATTDPDFGIGFYTDAKDGGGASWIDATHTNYSGLGLALQAEVNIAKDRDGDSLIGDLDTTQAGMSLIGYPLLETVLRGCDDLSDHSTDPAPGAQQFDDASAEVELSARVQVGTEASIAKEQELADTKIGIPSTTGIDVAALDASYSTGTSYSAFEAGMRIELPDWLEIDQPWIWICAGGHRSAIGCVDEESFDATPATFVYLSTDQTDGDLGDLDVEYIGDNACNTCEGDGNEKRIDAHLDQIPNGFTTYASIYNRHRDNAMDISALLLDRHGRSLEPIRLQYTDDYNPARYGDESEAATLMTNSENDQVANFDISVTNMTSSLYVTGELNMPTYGALFAPYGAGDCGDYSTWEQADHVYPYADEPSDWSVRAPRDADEIRAMYVHADLDMQQHASSVDFDADIRVDGHNQDDDYDSETTSAQRIRIETDETVDADVHALMPGVQQRLSTREHVKWTWIAGIILFPIFGFNLVIDVDADFCLDIDVPVYAGLDDIKRASIGLDGLKGTLSVLDDDVISGGGNVELAFKERYVDAGGSFAYVDGIWAEETMAWFSVSSYDWFTHMDQERKTIGIIDADDPGRDAGAIPQTEIDTDTMQGSWAAWSSDGDDEHWGSFMYDPLFHEDIENEWSDNLLTQWPGFWTGVGDSSDALYDVDWAWWGWLVANRWDMPDIDAAVTASNDSDTFHTTSQCAGEDQDDWGPFAEMSDGTYFEIEVRHGSGGRVEVLLVGYYDTGHVRFVRELHDDDYGWGIACNKWKVEADFDTETHADAGLLILDLELNRKKNLGRYKEKLDTTFVFDASGNGWEEDGTLTTSTSVAGEDAAFSGGHDGTGSKSICQWLPGDGQVIDADPADPSTFTHVYDFAGNYAVMQLCYDDDNRNKPDVSWATVTIS